jgi:hypothetical protein
MKYTLKLIVTKYMLKFSTGIFAWSLLSITVICNAHKASAQSETITPLQNSVPTVSDTTPDTTKNEQTNLLAVSDRNIQILKSINDRHRCGIADIDKDISRADFANNIAVCLTSLEVKLTQNSTAVPAEDLAQLKELTNLFMDEVSYLGNRVETLEKKVTAIQKTSNFSTTTKLNGEVVVGLTTFNSQTRTGDTNSGNTVFTNRVRLNLDTTFTGKDRLRTRLQSRNVTPLSGSAITGTNTTRLGVDGNENNSTTLSKLEYTMPVFDKSKLIIETVGSEFNENVYTFNPQFASSGSGALTRFGRFNPIYRLSGDGAGATLDYRFSPEFSAAVGYAIPGAIASNPNNAAGVFGGDYSGIVQLRYQPSNNLDFGLSYARSYHSSGSGITGSTGSSIANSPFNTATISSPTVANHYSFLASAKLSPGFTLSGWLGLTNASVETGGSSSGNADIYNAAITAAFSDIGGKGNVLGFIVGIPPTVSNVSSNIAGVNGRVNPSSALHLETLYKIKVSDNLEITPGMLLITNPESSAGGTRGSEFVGTVRTTFKF